MDCPEEQRFLNFRQRRLPYGETEDESRATFLARQERQEPLEKKKQHAYSVLHNDMGKGLTADFEKAWAKMLLRTSKESLGVRINWYKNSRLTTFVAGRKIEERNRKVRENFFKEAAKAMTKKPTA